MERQLVVIALSTLLGTVALADEGLDAQRTSAGRSTPTTSPIHDLEGVYKVRFENGDVEGNRYQSENILEIVPYGVAAAYFRIHLEFFNGHECATFGMARWEARKLVYDSRANGSGQRACHLEITLEDQRVRLSDLVGEVHTCEELCGARGSMQSDWPRASRRTIRYKSRLRGSWQYRAAVAEHERPGRDPTGAE